MQRHLSQTLQEIDTTEENDLYGDYANQTSDH